MHRPSPFQLNPEDFGDIMAQLCVRYYAEERKKTTKPTTVEIFQSCLGALGMKLPLRLLALKSSIN